MTRPSLDATYMNDALNWAKRSTCCRRQVGAVIVDAHGYTLSTGYNGQPSGFTHCTDQPCPGALFKSGEGLDLCEALHAEQNAIARLKEPFNAKTMYATTAPCIACTKLALATSIERIVFLNDYPNGNGRALWEKAGRTWEHYEP